MVGWLLAYCSQFLLLGGWMDAPTMMWQFAVVVTTTKVLMLVAFFPVPNSLLLVSKDLP